MTLEQELTLFLEEYNTRYISPEAIIALRKTFQSHNITIEDWNSLVKYLESNDISINSLYSFIETLVPEVTNKVSKTGDEDVAGFKNFTTGLKISGGGETVTFTVTRNTADASELDISGAAYVTCHASVLLDVITCNLLVPTCLGNEDGDNCVYVHKDFTFKTYVNVVGQSSYGVKVPDTSNWTQNKTLATTEDVIKKYLYLDYVSIPTFFKSYNSFDYFNIGTGIPYFTPDVTHKIFLPHFPQCIGSIDDGNYTLADADTAFNILKNTLHLSGSVITDNVLAVYQSSKYNASGTSTLIFFRNDNGDMWSYFGDL